MFCLVAILKKTPWKAYIKIMDEYINQLAQDLESEKAYIRWARFKHIDKINNLLNKFW